MADTDRRGGLFPALLKHWRGQRGMSQLDLAVAADVSSRHVSFLETGRSAPSAEMVLRLAATLDVPLRHTNAMLDAAGFPPAYEQGDVRTLPAPVAGAVAAMKAHHEPFPLVVVDRAYTVVDANDGAQAVIGAAVRDPGILEQPLNLARLTFDPAGASGAIVNFDEVGRALLWRIQREVLAEPDDGPLRDLLDALMGMPTVHAAWREVDLAVPSSPALEVHLRVDGHDLRFLTTVTMFQAPQAVVVDELRIETWFPVDAASAAACEALSR